MERKITEELTRWRSSSRKKALVVTGERQIGKTYSIDEFGKANYRSYLRVDFSEDPEAADIFREDIYADRIIDTLRTRYRGFRIVEGSTLLFLDEIQLCTDALSALKPLVKDGRMDIIASGSMLSVNGLRSDDDVGEPEGTENTAEKDLPAYGRKRVSPMGYATLLRMYPMDFEEYLWATGVDRDITSKIRQRIHDKREFDRVTLSSLERYFRQYLIIGGFPEAVLASLDPAEDPGKVLHDLRNGYIADVQRYAPPAIRSKVQACFDSVPSRLCKENKRFTYRDVEGRSNVGWREYSDPVTWLESSGLVSICRNLTEPVQPLATKTGNGFKMYMCDTGLLMDSLGDGARIAIDRGEFQVNEGGIVENAVANMIERCGIPLTYFERDKVRDDGRRDRIEVDFVVELDGDVTAIEVKSGRKRSAPSLNKFITEESYRNYHVKRLIRFGTTNISVDENGVEHYPLFAAAFVDSMCDRTRIEFSKDLELDL